MEEWKQRLTQARKAKGLSKTAFAKAVGVSNPTATDWEKSVEDGGIKEISGSNLAKAAETLDVDSTWILLGKGRGPGSPDASEVDIKHLLPGAIGVRAVDEDDPSLTHIPKVKLKLSAGITGFDAEPERFDGSTLTVPTSWLKRHGYIREKLLATRVGGESMETTLYDGDVVIVNTADTTKVDGAVYAFNYEGEAVIKRLARDAGQWWLTSDNPDQRKYHRKLCKGGDCIIVGRVVRRESDRL
jgi:phage repressor protein C with HTH and peptisase S24 domain